MGGAASRVRQSSPRSSPSRIESSRRRLLRRRSSITFFSAATDKNLLVPTTLLLAHDSCYSWHMPAQCAATMGALKCRLTCCVLLGARGRSRSLLLLLPELESDPDPALSAARFEHDRDSLCSIRRRVSLCVPSYESASAPVFDDVLDSLPSFLHSLPKSPSEPFETASTRPSPLDRQARYHARRLCFPLHCLVNGAARPGLCCQFPQEGAPSLGPPRSETHA